MKTTLITALALASFLSVASPAFADDASDRSQAIQICRTEVANQAGSGAEVRLDQARVRLRLVRVDLDVWRNGQLQNVRCDVNRTADGQVTIASITPSFQTASLAQ